MEVIFFFNSVTKFHSLLEENLHFNSLSILAGYWNEIQEQQKHIYCFESI